MELNNDINKKIARSEYRRDCLQKLLEVEYNTLLQLYQERDNFDAQHNSSEAFNDEKIISPAQGGISC